MLLATKLMPDLCAEPGTGWSVLRDNERAEGWHPHIRALLLYWQQLRRDGRLPSRSQINPAELRGLLPYIWMLDVHRAPWRFRYRLAGTRFVSALGRDLTNRWYDEARPVAYGANRTRLITVARDGVATWRRGPMPLEDENGELVPSGWQDVENLMLPLAANGATVDIILGIAVPYLQNGQPIFAELA